LNFANITHLGTRLEYPKQASTLLKKTDRSVFKITNY